MPSVFLYILCVLTAVHVVKGVRARRFGHDERSTTVQLGLLWLLVWVMKGDYSVVRAAVWLAFALPGVAYLIYLLPKSWAAARRGPEGRKPPEPPGPWWRDHLPRR